MPKEKGSKIVTRLDEMDFARWMTVPFARTTEGFLTGRAIVTSVGVFTYLNKDGSFSRELRLPEEVFDSDSLNSMKLKPLALDHPSEKITPDNADQYQVGTLGNNPSSTTQQYQYGTWTDSDKLTDGMHVAIDMSITRSEAIEAVLNGKRALSMGYECEIEPSSGVWCGIDYDGIQRKIRYNHCAIVDAARAGDEASIRMDSADAVLVNNYSKPKNEEGKKMGMKKINLDGVDYEGEEKLIQSFVDQRKRADSAESALEKARTDSQNAQASLSKMEADRDTCKDRADKAETALKELQDKALDPAHIDAAVNAKLLLMDAAERAKVELKDGMSDADVRKAVIMATFPTAKLDGKDDIYISARFDAAIEVLDSKNDGASRIVAADNLGGTHTDAAAARTRYLNNLKARSRGEKVEG
ncbi:MAG: hypothetical protein Ta2G_11000 [Termitinemataceae bacterium]|nr:MAG: hypothetical protein Ta2G_11000 [Termitinemataceae bacterium]